MTRRRRSGSSSRPSSRARTTGPRRRPAVRYRSRGATLADLPTLVLHRRKMWEDIRRFRPGELDRHDRAYRRWARDGMRAGTLLARIVDGPDGRPVASGALWLMPYQPRPGPLGRQEMPYILSMYTSPSARRRGLGSRIVRELVAWSREHGYGRVVLHASRFGRPVYERLGFVNGSEMRLTLRPRRA